MLSALGIVIIFLLSAAFTLGAQEEAKGAAGFDEVNENRSQVLVTGKDYALNYEQEQEHREELAREEKNNEERQERVEEQREQIETPEEEPENIVEREEQRREEERREESQNNPPEEKPEEQPKQEEPKEEQEQKQEDKPENKPEDKQEETSENDVVPDEQEQEQDTPPSSDESQNTDSNNTDENPQESQEDNSNNDNQDEPQNTPADDSGGSGSNDDNSGDGEGDTPGDSDDEAQGDGEDGTGGDDNPGDGGDGGSNPAHDPEEPEDVNKDPIIDCSLSDGETIPGADLMFTLKGTDYKGQLIDSFYYSVTIDGSKLYSEGVSGSFTTYRARGLSDGSHEINIIVTDVEGNNTTVFYTVNADGESDEEVFMISGYLTLDITHIGRGTPVYDFCYEVPEGTSVSDFVEKALGSCGYAVQRGVGSSFYLARIVKPGIVGNPDNLDIPEEYNDEVYLQGQDSDSLGEKDIVASSGWLYMYNGVYMDVGMGSVTLEDGDEVLIWFTLDPLRDPYI